MFFKLALRNVRRSFRDYGVYLLTLTFGVCQIGRASCRERV